MKETNIHQAYEIAKERYAALGVDTEKVIDQLQNFHLSMHCWQADDVKGFEVQAGALSGGIQSTGNYPGAARNIDELRADVLKAKSLIPGTHRLNLHEIYGDFQGKVVDRDEVTVDYFKSWIDWAKENNTPLDFNSTTRRRWSGRSSPPRPPPSSASISPAWWTPAAAGTRPSPATA